MVSNAVIEPRVPHGTPGGRWSRDTDVGAVFTRFLFYTVGIDHNDARSGRLPPEAIMILKDLGRLQRPD
jgi:hypothetical protein